MRDQPHLLDSCAKLPRGLRGGEVDNPGLVTVAPDARIADALDHARPKPGIDLLNLNLAKRLTDGEQIVVGMPAPVPGSAGEPGQGPLSLNAATKEQLMDLKASAR